MRRLVLTSSCLALPLLFACADSEGPDGSVDVDEAAGDSTGTDDEVGESSSSTADDNGDATTTNDNPTTDATEDSPTTDDATTDDATTDDATTDDATTDDTTTGDGDIEASLTFVAMGDAGEGSMEQYAVADAIEMVCADKNCEFVLYLGDNFYDDGVASAMDDQFQTKFEMPYADIGMPFKIVLGNHDYGMLSFAWEKSAYEIEYTNYSDKWELPSEYYTFSQGGVDFFVLDTTQFMWDHNTSDQQNWVDGAIGSSSGGWKIAAAHHPYLSNGEHGNAGNYEGFPFPPQLAGTTVKNVLDDSICGKVDLYLSGHDHNRQWNTDTCQGTSLIVSGGGAKTTDFAYHGGGNDVWWEDDAKPGFLLVEINGNTMHTAFYDYNGVLDYERDIVK